MLDSFSKLRDVQTCSCLRETADTSSYLESIISISKSRYLMANLPHVIFYRRLRSEDEPFPERSLYMVAWRIKTCLSAVCVIGTDGSRRNSQRPKSGCGNLFSIVDGMSS